MRIETYESWREVESHTEHALLFSTDTEVFGLEFHELIERIRSMIKSESLTIRAITDGIERVKEDDYREFLNSVWVVDYEVLYGEDECTHLRDRLGGPLFPDTTRVYVFIDDADVTRSSAVENVSDDFGIPESDVVVARLSLEGMLRNYFQMVNPDRGEAGKREIFSWTEDVRRVM